MSYTPGPWIVEFDPDDLNSKNSTLRILDSRDMDHPQGPLTIALINVGAHAPHMDEPLANAALISAAPDLLAALQLIDRICRERPEHVDVAKLVGEIAAAMIAPLQGE